MKKNKKPTKKIPRSQAPESPAPAVAVKRVQICSGNNRPASDSPPEIQPPTNPLAATQRLAAFDLSRGPIEELEKALSVAPGCIHPFSMKDKLAKLDGDAVLPVAIWAKDTAGWINTSDPAKAAEALCQFTFELVEKLNQLDDAGALRLARKRITEWPTNVARPGVGTEAHIVTRPESRAGTAKARADQTKGNWREWVEAACEAARFNNRYGLAFAELRRRSTLERTVNLAPRRMRKEMPVQWYRTLGGRVFLWPWWMDACFVIPEELRPESLDAYERAVEGLLLWHLVVHRAMKEGAAMLGEEFSPPRGGKGGGVAHGRIGADYDPELANRINWQVIRTLRALARDTRKRTAA
jgi:hypothetical protein